MTDDLAQQLAIWWRKWDAQAAARGRPVKRKVEERAPWLPPGKACGKGLLTKLWPPSG